MTVGPKFFWGGYSYDDLLGYGDEAIMADAAPGDMAAILFTSGSTGVPKGAVYTHENFGAQVECLRRDYGIETGERDLATFPLFALFGPALGMAAIVPDMNASKPITADPRNIIAAIHDCEATNLFASPALVEKVGRYAAEHRHKLPSLKRVISAGAPARRRIRFEPFLVSPYRRRPSDSFLRSDRGFACEQDRQRGTYWRDGLPHGCWRRRMRRSSLSMESKRASSVLRTNPFRSGMRQWSCPLGRSAEICVKGPVVTEAYYGWGQSLETGKIRDSGNGGIWHRMGDVGYFDHSSPPMVSAVARRIGSRPGRAFFTPFRANVSSTRIPAFGARRSLE